MYRAMFRITSWLLILNMSNAKYLINDIEEAVGACCADAFAISLSDSKSCKQYINAELAGSFVAIKYNEDEFTNLGEEFNKVCHFVQKIRNRNEEEIAPPQFGFLISIGVNWLEEDYKRFLDAYLPSGLAEPMRFGSQWWQYLTYYNDDTFSVLDNKKFSSLLINDNFIRFYYEYRKLVDNSEGDLLKTKCPIKTLLKVFQDNINIISEDNGVLNKKVVNKIYNACSYKKRKISKVYLEENII